MSEYLETEWLDEEDDIDVCQGCGTYYGPHWGLKNWRNAPGERGDIAPQLCAPCWRMQGYYWPERPR